MDQNAMRMFFISRWYATQFYVTSVKSEGKKSQHEIDVNIPWVWAVMWITAIKCQTNIGKLNREWFNSMIAWKWSNFSLNSVFNRIRNDFVSSNTWSDASLHTEVNVIQFCTFTLDSHNNVAIETSTRFCQYHTIQKMLFLNRIPLEWWYILKTFNENTSWNITD